MSAKLAEGGAMAVLVRGWMVRSSTTSAKVEAAMAESVWRKTKGGDETTE